MSLMLNGQCSWGAWEAFMRKSMRARPEGCAHVSKISVIVAGLERTVCDACGHVSFAHSGELTGELDRRRFARPADDLPIRREGILEGLSAG